MSQEHAPDAEPKNRIPLQSAMWAKATDDGKIYIDTSPRPIQMVNSDGTGEPLVSHDGFGADVVRFAGGKGVSNHTHEGAHILFVLSGYGTLTYAREQHQLFPGLSYLVPSMVEHAIAATTDLVLIAVGNIHRPVGSVERMTPVPSRS